MAMEGVGVARDAKRGQELLQRACSHQDAEACRLANLGSAANAFDAGVGITDPEVPPPRPANSLL